MATCKACRTVYQPLRKIRAGIVLSCRSCSQPKQVTAEEFEALEQARWRAIGEALNKNETDLSFDTAPEIADQQSSIQCHCGEYFPIKLPPCCPECGCNEIIDSVKCQCTECEGELLVRIGMSGVGDWLQCGDCQSWFFSGAGTNYELDSKPVQLLEVFENIWAMRKQRKDDI